MRARLQRRHAKLVSFSGIDGAGKSTQIHNLCARIEESGLRVRVFQFWDDVATFARFRESGARVLFKGDTGVGTPSAPINRRDKNVQSWPMTCVRLCIYLADAVSTSIFVKRAQRSGVDVLIFDRYIYDELANLRLDRSMARFYARMIAALVPTPDIALVLDAEPGEARARKPEYPIEFLKTCRRSYLTLSNLVGCMKIIAPQSKQEVEAEILSLAAEELPLITDLSKTPDNRDDVPQSDVDSIPLQR